MSAPARRVLVVSATPIAKRMAGPSIRSLEIARALAPHADVTIAAATLRDESHDPSASEFPVVAFRNDDPSPAHAAIAGADVIIGQPLWPAIAAVVRRSPARLLVDLYDPEPLELLELTSGPDPVAHAAHAGITTDRLLNALHDGAGFFCASEKQRDLWIGAMMGRRLLTRRVYEADPSLSRLLQVVPFGLPEAPPEPGPGPREHFPVIGPADRIVLWNGGIWSWLDTETPIRAVAQLAEEERGLPADAGRTRMVFMGSKPGQAATDAARALAAELGVLDDAVLFNSDWVPYEGRGGWLLQADAAVSTHDLHLESRFAFRTRMLDCFWAGLPVVCTRGDELGDRVESEGLGVAVGRRDPAELAAALRTVLSTGRPAYAAALAAAADRLRWSQVTRPLVEQVLDPDPLPSLGELAGARRPLDPALLARDTLYRVAARTVGAAGLDRVARTLAATRAWRLPGR